MRRALGQRLEALEQALRPQSPSSPPVWLVMPDNGRGPDIPQDPRARVQLHTVNDDGTCRFPGCVLRHFECPPLAPQARGIDGQPAEDGGPAGAGDNPPATRDDSPLEFAARWMAPAGFAR